MPDWTDMGGALPGVVTKTLHQAKQAKDGKATPVTPKQVAGAKASLAPVVADALPGMKQGEGDNQKKAPHPILGLLKGAATNTAAQPLTTPAPPVHPPGTVVGTKLDGTDVKTPKMPAGVGDNQSGHAGGPGVANDDPGLSHYAEGVEHINNATNLWNKRGAVKMDTTQRDQHLKTKWGIIAASVLATLMDPRREAGGELLQGYAQGRGQRAQMDQADAEQKYNETREGLGAQAQGEEKLGAAAFDEAANQRAIKARNDQMAQNRDLADDKLAQMSKTATDRQSKDMAQFHLKNVAGARNFQKDYDDAVKAGREPSTVLAGWETARESELASDYATHKYTDGDDGASWLQQHGITDPNQIPTIAYKEGADKLKEWQGVAADLAQKRQVAALHMQGLQNQAAYFRVKYGMEKDQAALVAKQLAVFDHEAQDKFLESAMRLKSMQASIDAKDFNQAKALRDEDTKNFEFLQREADNIREKLAKPGEIRSSDKQTFIGQLGLLDPQIAQYKLTLANPHLLPKQHKNKESHAMPAGGIKGSKTGG